MNKSFSEVCLFNGFDRFLGFLIEFMAFPGTWSSCIGSKKNPQKWQFSLVLYLIRIEFFLLAKRQRFTLFIWNCSFSKIFKIFVNTGLFFPLPLASSMWDIASFSVILTLKLMFEYLDSSGFQKSCHCWKRIVSIVF